MNAVTSESGGIALGKIRASMFVFALALAALITAAGFFAATVRPAEALPSYARQTGQPCAACHTAFPELTPFGRRFKIGGYTLGGGDWKGPPVAMMYMPSFTHTQSNQDSPPAPGLHTNDNLVSQQVSGFIAGQLYGNVGSFIQITGDPTVANTAFVDASDVRYADTLTLFGKDTIWGIDANNTPTVEDPWNTTPSFGWPQISSTIAPAFGPPLTHIENGYGQIVGGAGAYVFWNDMLYADLTFYKGLPVPVLQAFNTGNSTTDALSNVAPYWRLAIEPHWGDLYWEVGTFGMYGQITPGRQYGYGTDNYLDVAFDSQIQYAGDQYSVTVKLTDIMEWQKLNATYGLGGSSNLATPSTASRPTHRSSGITLTASVLATSTSLAPGTAIFTAPATTSIAHRRASANSTTAISAVQTATASSSTSPTSRSAMARRFPIRRGTCGSACSSPTTCTSTAARPISTAHI
jgi:hypothetical protein